MTDRYTKQFNFLYPYLIMARVTAVYDVAETRKLLVDVAALDGRGAWQQVPLSSSPGVARNYRKGQIVGLLFRHSAANYPTAIAHIYNLEKTDGYTDPLPLPFALIDDQVYHHPETGAFLRFRSVTTKKNADAGTPAGGGDGQPATVEVTLSSGASLVLEERDATTATASLTLPSGASIVVDPTGNVTITSPTLILFDAPNVEFGDDTKKGKPNAILRQEDGAKIVAALNAFIAVFNAHVHNDAGGSGLSGTSSTDAVAAVAPDGSANAFSE